MEKDASLAETPPASDSLQPGGGGAETASAPDPSQQAGRGDTEATSAPDPSQQAGRGDAEATSAPAAPRAEETESPPFRPDNVAPPAEGGAGESKAAKTVSFAEGAKTADGPRSGTTEPTFDDVLRCQGALAKLSGEPLAVRTSVKILRIATFVNRSCAEFQTWRASLVRQLGSPVENGDYRLTPENAKIFNAKVKEMGSRPVQVDPSVRFALAEIASATLSAGELERLSIFITDL